MRARTNSAQWKLEHERIHNMISRRTTDLLSTYNQEELYQLAYDVIYTEKYEQYMTKLAEEHPGEY